MTARLLFALATVAAGIFLVNRKHMIGVLATIALRLAVCARCRGRVWRWFGLSRRWWRRRRSSASLLARPLLDLASEIRRRCSTAHWRDVEGRHYAFHGRPVQRARGREHERWVRLADVRAIVGFTASDGALAVAYPDGVRRLGRPPSRT